MKECATVSFIRSGLLYILVLTCLGVLGCAGVVSSIPPERRISLVEAENNQGNFSYGSLTLQYNYALTGGNLVMGGSNMMLAGKATYTDRFDSLDIYVVFLDAAGTVLQRKFIYSSGYRTDDGRVSDRAFQETLEVPAGSEAITFTYSEIARSGRD
jgi:hypothetical protein